MKKLTKSRDNSVIMGVCGGLGEFFNIDPIIIRVIWVISSIPMFFTSAVIYLVCGIIIPDDDGIIYQNEDKEDGDFNDSTTKRNSSFFIGVLLVIIGLYFFAVEFFPDIMNIFRLWPILLIVAGIYIIFNRKS